MSDWQRGSDGLTDSERSFKAILAAQALEKVELAKKLEEVTGHYHLAIGNVDRFVRELAYTIVDSGDQWMINHYGAEDTICGWAFDLGRRISFLEDMARGG